MKSTDLLGVKVAKITAPAFKEEIRKMMEGSISCCVGKINTEFLLRARKNDDFRETLKSFDINIADGKGVLWAAKYLSLPTTRLPLLRQLQAIWQMAYSGASLVFYPRYCKKPIPENISGVEAMYLMLEAAIEADASVYFLGAMEDVNKEAIEMTKKRYPKLQVAGGRGGFWEEGEEVDDVNKSGASLLIVALGSPKQEFWIRDNIDKLTTVKVAVGEGGSLDFVAGSFKRAPKWMQGAALEWLWRLFMNKSKSQSSKTGSRAKRVWKAVPVFIYEVVKYKVNRDKK